MDKKNAKGIKIESFPFTTVPLVLVFSGNGKSNYALDGRE
jgi:hypothetical protein